MTAEEYVKHYASGQGGYESVPVNIALRAIEYAKREAKQQIIKDAVDGTMGFVSIHLKKPNFGEKLKEGDKVKVLVIKEE